MCGWGREKVRVSCPLLRLRRVTQLVAQFWMLGMPRGLYGLGAQLSLSLCSQGHDCLWGGIDEAALLLQARPLTRYLPIRKEDFDLKTHIESSGHSVDTCYHVILTEKMCKGYLVKMGGKIKSWKKRWFVFDRMKRTVSYYVGKSTPLLPHAPQPLPSQPYCHQGSI